MKYVLLRENDEPLQIFILNVEKDQKTQIRANNTIMLFWMRNLIFFSFVFRLFGTASTAVLFCIFTDFHYKNLWHFARGMQG